jgi:membrane associated rhomboid family serine protease
MSPLSRMRYPSPTPLSLRSSTGGPFNPARLAADPLSFEVWITVITAMFLHGGWLHLGGNMLYLWIFGNNIEDRLGRLRFLGFYLASGIAATLAHIVIQGPQDIPLLGASGAIAGVLGAYLVLFPRARVLVLIPILFIIELARVPAAFVIGFWFLIQVVQGVGHSLAGRHRGSRLVGTCRGFRGRRCPGAAGLDIGPTTQTKASPRAAI